MNILSFTLKFKISPQRQGAHREDRHWLKNHEKAHGHCNEGENDYRYIHIVVLIIL